MNAFRPRILFALVAIGSVLASGCSRSSGKLVPVDGSVRVNDKPAVGAIVTLHPVNGPADAPRPSGHVAEDGTFQLTTSAEGDGAAPGEYKVTVAWYTASARKGVLADESIPQSKLPATYNRPDATPLTANILPGQTDPLTISIKKK